MSSEDRIVDLEIRIAHQDALIAVLDEVVRTFAIRVERLEQQFDAVRRAAGDVGAIGPDEPPPHY